MRRMLILVLLAAMRADGLYAADRIRTGHPEWPVAWMTYRQVDSLGEDISARIVGQRTKGAQIDPDAAGQMRSQIEKELIASGWLTASRGQQEPSRDNTTNQ